MNIAHSSLQRLSRYKEDAKADPVIRSVAGEQVAVWCVCDGHHGQGAANFVARQCADELLHRTREDPPCSPGGELALAAGQMRQAVADTFVSLADSWELGKKFSGTTFTMAVLFGSLLTVANVGDSKAFLDTGNELVELSISHRIEDNVGERMRLSAAGARVARMHATDFKAPAPEGEKGIGKLRVWESNGLGRLRVSRAIGGVSIGKFIIPYPYVCQVLVPKGGCRLILGTDGLWDFLSASKVFSLVERMTPAAAAAALCKQAFSAQKAVSDDITVAVTDILPSHTSSWPQTVRSLRRHSSPAWLSCLAAPAITQCSGEEGSRLRRVASVDTFEECAPQRNDTVGRMAQRALLMRGDSAMQGLDKLAIAREEAMARTST
ncbi:g3766 [Coccomyxa viridis]|uniref:G3766 protein n=1 Tax=Coccomyxa viridis TaxID=1274662 RepID=A0ABP1FVI0_9CHLO